MKDSRLYTLKELAQVVNAYLGVDRFISKDIHRFIDSGQLKALKVGNKWQIRQNDLDVFIYGK